MASEPIVCHSYGHAHKHPAVIGKIAGWTLPTPVTPTQLGVFVGTFIALLVTNRIWGMFTPGFVRLVVLGGAPIVLAWAVRHLRVEGRSPVQMASGLFTLATAPRTGTLFGRTYRGWRRQPARGARLYFDAGPVAPAGEERPSPAAPALAPAPPRRRPAAAV